MKPRVQCAEHTKGGRCSRSAAYTFEIIGILGSVVGVRPMCGNHARMWTNAGRTVRKVAMPDGSPIPEHLRQEGK